MEKEIVKVERKSNIELLRIFAIIFIVCHHFAVHGFHVMNPDIYNSYSTFDKMFIECLMPGGLVGVAIFFIITGYFKINNNKISLSKIILEAVFYGLLILVIYFISLAFSNPYPDKSAYDIFKNIFTNIINPATTDVWWFLSSYIFVILLSPIINKIFSKLNMSGYLILTIIFLLFVYSLDLIIGSRYITITKGIIFYLIGGFISKFVKLDKYKTPIRIISLITFICSWGMHSYIYYFFYNTVISYESKSLVDLYNDAILLTLNTIFTPFAATSIFIFMLTFDFKNKVINFISKTTFGIYLLHDSIITRELIWKHLITKEIMETMNLELYTLLIITSILLIGFMVEVIRIKFVENKMIIAYNFIVNKFKEKHYIEDTKE